MLALIERWILVETGLGFEILNISFWFKKYNVSENGEAKVDGFLILRPPYWTRFLEEYRTVRLLIFTPVKLNTLGTLKEKKERNQIFRFTQIDRTELRFQGRSKLKAHSINKQIGSWARHLI